MRTETFDGTQRYHLVLPKGVAARLAHVELAPLRMAANKNEPGSHPTSDGVPSGAPVSVACYRPGDKTVAIMLPLRDQIGVLRSTSSAWLGVSGMGRPAARIQATMCLALILAGCARVTTNVEVFHDLPADYAGQQIAIVPADPNKANTIEFRTYSSKLAAKLTDAGFQVVPPDLDQPPHYIAALAYGVGAQQAGAAYTSGSVTPDYGGGGQYHGVTTVARKYPRALVVGIYKVPGQEAEEPRQVYSMTALSTGRCRALSSVIDPILDAAFTDFPGESGRSRTVTTPMPGFSC